MKKIILSLILVLCSTVLMAQNPTFDSVKFKRGGKIWKLITYGSDSADINGLMFHSGAHKWATSGQFITPNPSTKIIKYPGIPSTVGGSGVPGSYRQVYWDNNTNILGKVEGSAVGGGGGAIEDNDTLTGCQGVFIFDTPAADIAVNMDSIINICGCMTVKNMGFGSTITITSIEGLLLDSAAFVVLGYNEWVNLCPDSTRFVTMGSGDVSWANPMTTAGDILYDTTGNTVARLGIVTGRILGTTTVGSSVLPAWINNTSSQWTSYGSDIGFSGNVGIGNTAPSEALSVGNETKGGNVKIYATLGAEMAPALTDANWTGTNGWTESTTLDKASNAAIGTETMTGGTDPTAGLKYRVVITASATSGAITYTWGGTAGTAMRFH